MAVFSNARKDYYDNNFTALDMAAQKYSSLTFEECTFSNCDFSAAAFTECSFVECRFLKCNLSVVDIKLSKFNDVVFEDCKAIGIDWTQAKWPNIALLAPIRFIKCIINDATFFGLRLNEIEIEGCKAHDVDFREGEFCEAILSFTDFTNSLFNQTNLTGADFTGATNYRIDINHNIVRKAKFSRYEAVSLLDSLDIELID
jgi:uncharacterized protein YjbI with pentapeptide repeats